MALLHSDELQSTQKSKTHRKRLQPLTARLDQPPHRARLLPRSAWHCCSKRSADPAVAVPLVTLPAAVQKEHVKNETSLNAAPRSSGCADRISSGSRCPNS